MSHVRVIRRLVSLAAIGGGGLVGAGVAAFGVLAAEAALARHMIGPRRRSAPYDDGLYGPRRTGTSLRYVMIGDSSAAGLGLDSSLETPGALIAQAIVDAADRPVRFVNVATVGARSADLEQQVSRALMIRPHVVTIMIGANDVTHLGRPQAAVGALGQAVFRLVNGGSQVVVGTCPDIGSIGPILPPLRNVARRLSRQLAAAQTVAVVEAGGRSVSLAHLLGPRFAAEPEIMFGSDRFHPSREGYAAAAQVLLPSVLAALDLPAVRPPVTDVSTLGREILPVVRAADVASDEAGTEVAGTRVAGDERGPMGRWALVVHRPAPELPAAEPPSPLESESAPVEPGGPW